MRAVLFLCIALLGVSAAFAADSKGPSTWLRDYMSPAKASAMSGYYEEEMEKATMCFRTASYCVKEGQEMDTLTCAECPEFHHRKYDEEGHQEFAVDEVGQILGKCMFDKNELVGNKVPLIGKPGYNWAGTFYGTCYMDNSGKDLCELPEGCENTILAIQGVVYYIDNAVMVGPVEKNVPTCDGLKREGNSKQAAVPAADAASKPAKLQYAKEYYYGEQAPATVPAGPAWVYDGTFTTHGGHPLKFKTGHFQYSYFDGEGIPGDKPYAETISWPRLGDDTYKLEFIAEKKGHY